MRYVDIAIAVLIGTSAITGIVAWTPRSGDIASQHTLMRTLLRDSLLAYLQHRGVVWLMRSSPQELCADLSGISNSSVTFSATSGSFSCGSPPLGVAALSTLTLQLTSYQVTLEAWSNAGA